MRDTEWMKYAVAVAGRITFLPIRGDLFAVAVNIAT